ncbi:MAG: hypothetical protein E7003_03835 [Eggerthellaceae bacterium]|nr:hypothetical protein [Eggerthellaceae bacterium]
MDELVIKVYGILKDATEEVCEKNEAAAKVQRKIDSGAYAYDYVHSELIPERDHLKFEARDKAGIARERANEAIDEWQAKVKTLDILNPDDVVEGDYRLLTCGLPLTADDVLAIIDRGKAAGNRTMQQLCYRYAETHDLELPRDRSYRSAAQEARKADSLREVINIYVKNWMAADEAASMLQKLFGVTEN